MITLLYSYNRKTLDNDIALVKLTEKMSFAQDVRPVCLPTKGQTFAGKAAKVVGWGVTKPGSTNGVKRLREVGVYKAYNIEIILG